MEHTGNPSQFIIYQDTSQHTHIQVRLSDNTLWLTQAQIAELLLVPTLCVGMHICPKVMCNAMDEHRIHGFPHRAWEPVNA